jgi:acylphosphatase
MGEDSGAAGDGGVQRRAFVVHGRVQGVGFRWSASERARELGLQGSIWNRNDGAVELHVRGRAEAVSALEAWLASGPRPARVERVESVAPGAPAEVSGFQIRHGRG